jgi:hypothetical protein
VTQIQLQLDLSNWFVNLAFWVCLAFPAVTAIYWPWWHDIWGWSIVILELLVPLALLAGVLRIDFGLRTLNLLTFGWIELAALGLIPLVVIHRTWLIWHRQRKAVSSYPEEQDHDSAQVRRRNQPGERTESGTG